MRNSACQFRQINDYPRTTLVQITVGQYWAPALDQTRRPRASDLNAGAIVSIRNQSWIKAFWIGLKWWEDREKLGTLFEHFDGVVESGRKFRHMRWGRVKHWPNSRQPPDKRRLQQSAKTNRKDPQRRGHLDRYPQPAACSPRRRLQLVHGLHQVEDQRDQMRQQPFLHSRWNRQPYLNHRWGFGKLHKARAGGVRQVARTDRAKGRPDNDSDEWAHVAVKHGNPWVT